MHKQKHLLSLLTLGIVLTGFIACTKKTSSPAPTPTPTPTPTVTKAFSYKLNGATVTATLCNYDLSPFVTNADLTVSGTDLSKALFLYVGGSGVGTYPLTGVNTMTGQSLFRYEATNAEYRSYTGELKITKATGGKISGTFHFKAAGTSGASDTVTVTDGVFTDLEEI